MSAGAAPLLAVRELSKSYGPRRALAPAARRTEMFYVPDGIAPWPDQPAGRVLLFFQDVWGEALLRTLRAPVSVEVYLAPEDPKLADLERNVLAKLRRVVPRLEVSYGARSRTGLFEDPESRYGEIWYAVGGRRALLRSTTGPIVVAEIYELAGVAPPAAAPDPPYPGYPLVAPPRGAAPLFLLAWPLAAGLAFVVSRGRRRSSCANPV